MTSSLTASETFTRVHARYLASKVVADLHQCASIYGKPFQASIDGYRDELVEMLVHEYVDKYEFGFKKDNKRVVAWRYHVDTSGDLVGGEDDRPGGIYARADVSAARYFNYMSYSSRWFALTSDDREQFREGLPFSRTSGSLPGDGNGYWSTDRSYANGGRQLRRETFKPW